MNGINKKNLNSPVEWYIKSQWFIGAAKIITEKNAEFWDMGHMKKTDDRIYILDAYNTVPWLSFMAIECVLKGMLVAKGISPAKLLRHNINKDFDDASKFHPEIKKIPYLDYFVREYSDYAFTSEGGNRYPDKSPVPIFDSYWEAAEALRRFAKSKL